MRSTHSVRFLWPLFAGVAVTFAACNCGGPNAPCQSDRDCGGALVCLQTQTCAPSCTTDADCSAGKCSASGGCIATGTCGDNADCAADEACVAPGTCAKRCTTATDCTAGQACLQNHTCSAACTTAAQCKAGEKCSAAGGCVPDTGCGSNADCTGGQLCDTLGKCVSDCRQGACNPGAYCTPYGQCIATNNPDGGAPTCGGELFQSAKVDSNMLIAFDRSGSMNDQINGVSKWNIAKTAINQVVQQYQSQIQFGLMIFPAGGTTSTQCVPITPPSVTVAPNTANAIGAALDAGNPGGRTPIGGVLTAAGQVTELQDQSRANYVMLVTDGMETCNGNGVQAATNNLQQRGIRTFVVGFGNGVDPTNLSDIATAGGTPRPGTPKYYQADDATTLAAAFNLIAQGALGCEFKLATAPPDPSKMFIYVNGVLQNRDPGHANGWDYDPATVRITFYGGLCNLVATDPTAKVSIVYGCKDDSLIEQDKPDGGARLPNGSACTQNLDCANGLCSSGICGQPVGTPCTTPAVCASQVCTNGFCAPGIN